MSLCKLRSSCSSIMVLAALPLLISARAEAQSDGSVTQHTAGQRLLEEVVVTAQRRSELQRDVPIAITSLSSEQLETANVVKLGDLGKVTPSLRFDYVGAFAQPTIRGVGSSLATSGSGANVGIYIDGFYSPNPLAANFDLLNVQNIQVLKGPQGTLFGRNTTGGAILVTTAKPSDDSRAVVDLSYGRFNTQRYQAYATTGISDSVAVDIEGLYTEGDGFQRSVVTGSNQGRYENWSVRTGLAFEPTDRLSFLLRYKHERVDDPTTLVTNAYRQNGIPLTIGNIIPGTMNPTKWNEYAVSERIGFKYDSDLVQLTAALDLEGATLTSYTQYRRDKSETLQDLDQSSAPVFDILLPVLARTVTQEFLVNSDSDHPLTWTAGLFFFDYSDRWGDSSFSASNGPFMTFAKSSTVTRSYAAFIDATYALTDDLFLTAGVRYSHDQVRDAYFINYLNPPLGRFDLPTERTDRVTPRVVLRYKPTEVSSVYVSFTQGYKAPIINVGGGQLEGIDVEAEEIDSYEVGYKYEDGGLSLGVSAYYYDYKNLQVSSYRGTSALINNAASSRVYGVEGEVRYRIGALELNAGGAWTDAKFRSYEEAPGYFQCLDPATCGAEFGQFLIVPVDAGGFRMQRAPEFTGNMGVRYTIDGVAEGALALSANVYHSSKFFFDPANQFPQDAHTLVSLRAEWTAPSDKFTLAVYGDNVTGTRYRTQAFAGQFGVGSTWGYPATYGVQARLRY